MTHISIPIVELENIRLSTFIICQQLTDGDRCLVGKGLGDLVCQDAEL